MLKLSPWIVTSTLLILVVGCASENKPPETASPAVVRPINKARDAAQDAQQKAIEREQQDPSQPQEQPEQSGQ